MEPDELFLGTVIPFLNGIELGCLSRVNKAFHECCMLPSNDHAIWSRPFFVAWKWWIDKLLIEETKWSQETKKQNQNWLVQEWKLVMDHACSFSGYRTQYLRLLQQLQLRYSHFIWRDAEDGRLFWPSRYSFLSRTTLNALQSLVCQHNTNPFDSEEMPGRNFDKFVEFCTSLEGAEVLVDPTTLAWTECKEWLSRLRHGHFFHVSILEEWNFEPRCKTTWAKLVSDGTSIKMRPHHSIVWHHDGSIVNPHEEEYVRVHSISAAFEQKDDEEEEAKNPDVKWKIIQDKKHRRAQVFLEDMKFEESADESDEPDIDEKWQQWESNRWQLRSDRDMYIVESEEVPNLLSFWHCQFQYNLLYSLWCIHSQVIDSCSKSFVRLVKSNFSSIPDYPIVVGTWTPILTSTRRYLSTAFRLWNCGVVHEFPSINESPLSSVSEIKTEMGCGKVKTAFEPRVHLEKQCSRCKSTDLTWTFICIDCALKHEPKIVAGCNNCSTKEQMLD